MVGAIVGSTAAVWLGAVNGSRSPLSGHGRWSLTSASTGGDRAGGSHNCADGGVPASVMFRKGKLLIDSL